MPWFKIDDKLHDHPKVRRAGKAAMGVWVLAGSWSADNLQDGFVPQSVLGRWGTPRDAQRLCECGLWSPATKYGEPGWQFHEWETYQPTRAKVEAKRRATARRVERWRERRQEEDGEM
jgi:hypothetical protein